jgi:hypothetical protein
VRDGGKIPFNPNQPDIEQVRQIVFARLRRDQDWQQRDNTGEGFEPYVEYAGQTELDRRNGRHMLMFLVEEVFWQLVGECILAPGMNSNNPNLPWFHVTAYGKQVLAATEPQPFDPTGYLRHLAERVPNPDPTVTAYLAESLDTFRRGNLVASTVMLGIAAERVFVLLSESIQQSLASPAEKTALAKLLDRFAMKPKLDWIHNKIQDVQKKVQPGFPENATIMIVTIYDLMRTQRNELGHPREKPPRMKREDAFANLQIFPRYYEISEEIRDFLKSHQI